jgi:phage-related protein
MVYEVEILDSANDFLESLETKLQAKAYRTIGLLKLFGLSLTEPHSKAIKGTKKLRELRIKHATNICRIFYFYFKNKIFILTSGYIKKTNKTSKKEIEKALKMMNNILEERK